MQRATVCRFAQCAGCENSRNAVHDAVSRWVATRHVCYFVAARFWLSPVSYISLSCYFLFRLLFLRASPYYPKWYTSRADKPEYVDLTFPSKQMDEARQDIPSSLYAIISGSRFLSLSRSNFEMSLAISSNYEIMWRKFAKKRKKRGHALPMTQNLQVNIFYRLFLSYRIFIISIIVSI